MREMLYYTALRKWIVTCRDCKHTLWHTAANVLSMSIALAAHIASSMIGNVSSSSRARSCRRAWAAACASAASACTQIRALQIKHVHPHFSCEPAHRYKQSSPVTCAIIDRGMERRKEFCSGVVWRAWAELAVPSGACEVLLAQAASPAAGADVDGACCASSAVSACWPGSPSGAVEPAPLCKIMTTIGARYVCKRSCAALRVNV